MSNLDTAIMIANKAHFGQKDKAGKPYILHPLRLALKMNSLDEKIVAVLHDVIEDSSFSLNDIKESGFSTSVIDALVCMTKQGNEEYMSYIERVKTNKIATAVKLCDLEDNLNVIRLIALDDKDLQRVKKYHGALKYLAD